LDTEARQELQSRRIVAIDPNMRDLLFCADEADRKKVTNLRYTQDQRRRETNAKRYRNKVLSLRKRTCVRYGERIRTVEDWEATLTPLKRNSVKVATFMDYVQQKLLVNCVVAEFYRQPIFRKLKLSAHIRREKSEAKFLNAFKKTYGGPDQAIVAYGDWSDRRHRKYHEPVKGIGFRKMFARAGYKVWNFLCVNKCHHVTHTSLCI